MEKPSTRRHGGYLQALLESSPYAIMAINADGIITFANAEACKLTGREMQELVGENIAVVYENVDVARETNRRLYMGGGILRNYEVKAMTKSGKLVPIRISVAHLKDSTGNYLGAVGFFEDYRPWTAAEATMKARIDELEAKLEEWKDVGAPVFELCPGLTAVVVVGRLDTDRLTRVTQSLLDHVKNGNSRVVIIDLSASLVDDVNVPAQLVRTIRTVRLLGAESCLVGLQPAIAQAIEPLVSDLSLVRSFSSTALALESALGTIGLGICKKN